MVVQQGRPHVKRRKRESARPEEKSRPGGRQRRGRKRERERKGDCLFAGTNVGAGESRFRSSVAHNGTCRRYNSP